MAELNVQHKKKQNLLPWILLALGILALIIFLARGCNNTHTQNGTTGSDSVSTTTPSAAAAQNGNASNWDGIDFNSPALSYPEITNGDIQVRGNNAYSIYSLGENILFDTDKSELRGDVEKNLQQIVASIQKHHKGGEIRIFGYTDSKGSAGYNKELAMKRAESVENWMVEHGSISKSNVSLHPVGEARPVASNATSSGREQNRRVEIVSRGGESGK